VTDSINIVYVRLATTAAPAVVGAAASYVLLWVQLVSKPASSLVLSKQNSLHTQLLLYTHSRVLPICRCALLPFRTLPSRPSTHIP